MIETAIMMLPILLGGMGNQDDICKEVLVEVSGDSQTYLFTNHNDCYSDLCDVNDELGSWTDYLYWKPDTDNKGYPLAGKPIS